MEVVLRGKKKRSKKEKEQNNKQEEQKEEEEEKRAEDEIIENVKEILQSRKTHNEDSLKHVTIWIEEKLNLAKRIEGLFPEEEEYAGHLHTEGRKKSILYAQKYIHGILKEIPRAEGGTKPSNKEGSSALELTFDGNTASLSSRAPLLPSEEQLAADQEHKEAQAVDELKLAGRKTSSSTSETSSEQRKGGSPDEQSVAVTEFETHGPEVASSEPQVISTTGDDRAAADESRTLLEVTTSASSSAVASTTSPGEAGGQGQYGYGLEESSGNHGMNKGNSSSERSRSTRPGSTKYREETFNVHTFNPADMQDLARFVQKHPWALHFGIFAAAPVLVFVFFCWYHGIFRRIFAICFRYYKGDGGGNRNYGSPRRGKEQQSGFEEDKLAGSYGTMAESGWDKEQAVGEEAPTHSHDTQAALACSGSPPLTALHGCGEGEGKVSSTTRRWKTKAPRWIPYWERGISRLITANAITRRRAGSRKSRGALGLERGCCACCAPSVLVGHPR
ncbi:unnamed protein product [Amoebophrya sp. A120]|nr:unnamed protein product [Amoebophrya sp. A120]|eukprot:GSA120T00024474001.1